MRIKLSRNRLIELVILCILLLLYLTRHRFEIWGWRQIVLIFIFSTPIIYIKVSKRKLKEIYITKDNIKKSLFYGLIASIILIPLDVVIFHHALGGFYLAPELKESEWYFLLATFLGNTLTTGVSEEVLFRGFLQSYLKNYFSNFWIVLLQAIIFSLLHPRYYINSLYYISFLVFIFGIIAGFITIRTKNLSGSILAHGLVNTIGYILFYIYPIIPAS